MAMWRYKCNHELFNIWKCEDLKLSWTIQDMTMWWYEATMNYSRYDNMKI